VSTNGRAGLASKAAERIRRDLEERGVAPEFSRSISNRLACFTDELTSDTYQAVLSGVALAYGVHRQRQPDMKRHLADMEEVQRLMSSFSTELSKLEEALETLSAYVTRMKTQTSPARRLLH